MDCTTAMDSSSTNSDRSSHPSSPNSGGPTPLMVKQQPLSPTTNNNNNNNNTPTSINHNPSPPTTLPPPSSAASHHHHHSRHSPLSGPHPGVPGGHPLGVPHPLSPPPVGPRLAQSLQAHLPPPGLGLLGSLGVSGMLGHHGPLDLMAAHHGGPPRSYNSPPPISSSDPTANECKLVEYRGQKVAAFIIAGDTMLCLPQAFELFLKHLVGGLHTVYTKLKRLDIVPLVCNVEQVRILRGLGAIQPGVNRCKLLSCKDFDILYRDCTTARCFTMKATECSRPGRPPKRAPVGLSLAASHLHHQQMKKHRLDNGDYPPYENGHMDMSRMEKSPLLANGYNHPPHLSHMQFMQLPHPAAAHSALLSPGMPHGLGRPEGSVIKNQGMPPAMEAIARSGIWENCRAAYEDIVKHLERLREERGDVDRALALDQKVRDLSSHNGSPTAHSPVLNLSKSGGNGGGSLGSADDRDDRDADHSGSEADGPETALPVGEPHSPRSNPEDEEEENLSDPEEEDDKDQELDDGADLPIPAVPNSDSQQALNYSTIASAVAASATGGGSATPSGGGAIGPQDPSISSTETLLRNIQGLLKVAADNARQQERQINYEKAELKMDVLREREVKDSLERQLADEQKVRVMYQKRLRKERKARRRLQDQLDLEMKRRTQLEDALKNAPGGVEALRLINESIEQQQAANQAASGTNSGDSSVSTSPAAQQDSQSQSNPQQSQSRSSQPELGATGTRTSTESPPGGHPGSQGSTSSQSHNIPPYSCPSNPPSASSSISVRGENPSVTTIQSESVVKSAAAAAAAASGWSNYSGLDLMSGGAAFWQNYSESLAQELELERKSRQQQVERDVKSPMQDRANYYKNSVLFTSAT